MFRKIVGVLLIALPLAAEAVDGVVEINEAAALKGMVTPGDSKGYPVTLSVSGSYRVTSNLTQPDPDTPIIEVTATDVSIDLNGFTLRGTNNCVLTTRNLNGLIVADDVTCTQASATGRGIDGEVDGLSVRNGKITGTGGGGINAGSHARIEAIQVSHTGSSSVRIGSYGAVRDAVLTLSRSSGIFENGSGGAYDHITASRHDRMGIESVSHCTVTNTTANWNAFHGFDIRLGCSASNVSASRNGGNGFSSSQALLSQCNAAWNVGFGLSGVGGYDGCVMENNQGGSVSGMTRLGPSVCNGVLCP